MDNQNSLDTEAQVKSPQEILAMLRQRNREAKPVKGPDAVKVESVHFTLETMPTEVFKVEEAKPKRMTSQALFTQAKALREEAEGIWQKFFVAGRDETKRTVAKVYGLFYATMNSNVVDAKDKVLGKMKDALPKGKVRDNTKDAAIFIRYVFDAFDDKQVHVYGVALEYAFSKRVEPQGFESWVDGHKGGFEGVRKTAMQASAVNKPEGQKVESVEWEIGLANAKADGSSDVVDASEWDEDEPCRVYLAMPNDDGTASLKDAGLHLDDVKKVLEIFSKSLTERSKPKGKKRRVLNDAQKMARRQLKNDLFYQEQLVDEHRFDLADAIKRDHMIDKEQAEYKLCLAQSRIVSIKAGLASIGAPE
jgi:hypothetical protein